MLLGNAPLFPLLLVMWRATAAAGRGLSPWEFKDCELTGSRETTPVLVFTPTLMNLKRLHNLSKNSWIMFYGVTSNMDLCGLSPGYLYSITRKGDREFTFTRGSTSNTCEVDIIQLQEGSYGFVSCAQEEAQAIEASNEWWWMIPLSYKVLIPAAVGALFLLVIVVATTVGCIKRRKSRKAANLVPGSKRVAMRPIKDDSNYV